METESSAKEEEDAGQMRDTLERPDDESVDTEAGNSQLLN